MLNDKDKLTWTFRPRRTAMDLEFRREGSSWRSFFWINQIFCKVIQLVSPF